MTVERKNPNAVEIAQGQVSNGVTAANNRDNATETASFGTDLTLTVTSTSVTVTSAEMWGGKIITLEEGSPAPGGTVTFTLPSNEERGDFLIINNMTVDALFETSGQSGGEPTVPAGGRGHLSCDGIYAGYATLALSGIDRIVSISQAAYDALSPADPTTLYVITS